MYILPSTTRIPILVPAASIGIVAEGQLRQLDELRVEHGQFDFRRVKRVLLSRPDPRTVDFLRWHSAHYEFYFRENTGRASRRDPGRLRRPSRRIPELT